ncbi:MAG: acetyl-CoA hydrolase/transferase family protein [Bacillota bacterium]
MYREEYRRKLVSADRAAKVVKTGDWVDFGQFCGQAVILDEALARRKNELSDVKIWTLMGAYPSAILEADPEGKSFIWNSWHFSARDRRAADRGQPVYYSPMRYSDLPRYIRDEIEPIDVVMHQVAPMDRHGFFNFGPQNSHSRAVCDRASTTVVEVNEKQPRCLGGYGEAIHISEVDYIVEGSGHDLPELIPPAPTDTDRQVASIIVQEIEDGSCIQLGIGALANAVGQMIAESDLKDLGCHTEMLSDPYVDMCISGRLNGRRKNIDPGKIVYSFAMGSKKLYEFINDNPLCAIYPVDYTNKPSVAGLNDRLVTINNAVEVDLYGQVCSESAGTRQVSGTGGQLDFVMAAYESKGGKSFVCLPSCYRGKDGRLKSRIVPTLASGAIVTDPRTVAHYIVTEYGKYNLKGKTSWQRAEGLIGLAHPDFRENLIKEAERLGIWRRTNKI